MYIIDTNILTEFLFSNYIDNKISKKVETFIESPVISRLIPDFVLTELEVLVKKVIPRKYKLDQKYKESLTESLNNFIYSLSQSHKIISPDENEVRHGIDIYLNESKNKNYLSLTDSILLSVSETRNIEILTNDKKINTLQKFNSLN